MRNASENVAGLIAIPDLMGFNGLGQGSVPTARVTQPVGAFIVDSHTRFVVWAPNAEKVELQLRQADKEEQIAMQRNEWGYWSVEIEKTDIDYRYGYCLDDKGPMPDPASRFQPEGTAHLSAVVSTDYPWTDQNWKAPSLKEMIIYELHVGTFTNQSSLEAIIDKLDYLLDLGINAIELLPLSQFSGSRGWGYDGVFPYAVQHSYGGPQALRRLVDACHSKGIAVILDVVYNHLGPEGNCLPCFGPYLHKRYQQGWGDAINFDNKQADHVRSYFIGNALMWLNEYHIDGLRLDAVHSIWDFGATHFLAELTQAVRTLSMQTGHEYILIAESDLNDSKLLLPYAERGFGLDAQWLDDFHHSLHTLATGEKDHYYADFGTLSHLQKAFEHSYVYNGTYSPFREKTFGNSAQHTYFDQFVVYIQNHDQIGNRLGNDRMASLVSKPMLKAIAGTYLLSPYVPMLFMGEEYGETNPFFYFIDYSDDELVEAVRKGRKEEFEGFQKDELEYEDPQDVQTFARSRLSWDLQADGRAEILDFYKQLIRIRKTHPAFQNVMRTAVQSWIEGDKVLMWLQQAENPKDSMLLCAVAFEEGEWRFQLPGNKRWKRLIDSSYSDSTEQVETEITLSGPHFMAWTSVEE
ncbi:malto-oligosyltrehalose trehalohydrolase [Cytophagaceae bacterium YF14B1]|uniref:Malto-oligosyltrehalose trehalohydrolase n=1 Tax=Xanthocytophaga flava TaxID=3048013 RepID=A0AAE3QNS4_9BACT|nr:malto-oligosyltrehalose trehalohydrolase [Xanthocytophaga flavus]MDJ1480815.1 malto-oligosyltrehalose trehalohydrolase [Xanthocytophaga flavus]